MCWLMQDPTSLSLHSRTLASIMRTTAHTGPAPAPPLPAQPSSSSCAPSSCPQAPPSPGPLIRDSTGTYSSPLFLGSVFKSYQYVFLISLTHFRFLYSSWSGPQYLSLNNFFAVLSAPLYVKEVNFLEAHS